MAPASQDDFLHCTKIINGLSKCLWRAFVTIFIVYWAGISSDIFLTIFPVISKQLGWLQQSVTCFPHAIFTSLHRVVYPAVHTRKKQCVHGCVHQTLAGTAKENVFQPRPDLFVSFVTLLYSGLINGPSAGIWHQPSGLSELCSTHVGNQEKVWCK